MLVTGELTATLKVCPSAGAAYAASAAQSAIRTPRPMTASSTDQVGGDIPRWTPYGHPGIPVPAQLIIGHEHPLDPVLGRLRPCRQCQRGLSAAAPRGRGMVHQHGAVLQPHRIWPLDRSG